MVDLINTRFSGMIVRLRGPANRFSGFLSSHTDTPKTSGAVWQGSQRAAGLATPQPNPPRRRRRNRRKAQSRMTRRKSAEPAETLTDKAGESMRTNAKCGLPETNRSDRLVFMHQPNRRAVQEDDAEAWDQARTRTITRTSTQKRSGLFKYTLSGFFVCVVAVCHAAEKPPVIPVGLDAYRMWERWPYQRIGARAYMRRT